MEQKVYAYHITPKQNIESIRQFGLVPARAQGLSNLCRWECNWVTNNVHFIVEKQLTEKWIDLFKPRVLKIDVTDVDLIPKIYYDFKTQTIDVCKHEFVTKETIDSDKIIEITKLNDFLLWNERKYF